MTDQKLVGPDQADQVEGVAADFNLPRVRAARERTLGALEAIASRIKPGILEEEALVIAQQTLDEIGFEKNWHRPFVRFGVNTTKTFSEKSVPNVRLGEDDIFFLDIGTVLHGFEGDLGKTYTTGPDPEMKACAKAAEDLHRVVSAEWRKSSSMTGAELYAFASAQAQKMGWVLNLNAAGHRLSEFPHQVHYKGSLGKIGFRPTPNLWVLEIQIRHPKREFGAFFEDLLK